MIGELHKKVRKRLLYSSNTSDDEKQDAEPYHLRLQISHEALSLPIQSRRSENRRNLTSLPTFTTKEWV